MTFKPSPEQQAIFDYVMERKDQRQPRALAVNALAGTGKTTTIVELIRLVKARGIYCAFNKSIATEVQPKLADTQVDAKTFHSLGYGTLLNHLKQKSDGAVTRFDVQANKYRTYIQDHALKELDSMIRDIAGKYDAEERDTVLGELSKGAQNILEGLSNFGRLKLASWDDTDYLLSLVEDYDLGNEYTTPELVDECIQLLPTLMTWGEEETLAGRIDFTDMIYWVVRWDLRIYQHNWVFVDEAQDLNPMQRKMIQKALSKQGFIIIIGDVRQSIYRFAGADSDSFMQTVDMFNADILPLTVTRRCARIITQHAQTIVPEFRALESAERGKVVYREEALLVKDVQPRDMVICRVKAPLVATALELIGDGIPATILGSDIGRALVALAEKVAKQKGFRFEDFDLYLQTYQMKQVSKWIAKGDEARADAVRDECEALRVILESQTIRSLGDLESAVNNIFGDTEGDVVTLTTAHKSKGLEAKRVFLLKPEKMPLNYPQMHPEAVQQEDNLHYVAITRAQEVLVVLMNDTWRSKDGIIPPYAQTNFEDVVDEGAEEGSQENAHEGADGSEGEVIDGNTDADIHDEETQEDIQVPDTPQETWRKWARDLMESGFVVVDFETTGLNPRIEEITQIAIIDHEGRTLMNTLVKPQRPIQYGAQKVTGITPDKVKDAPNFREVYDNLMSALDGETVLAYNAPFDEQVLASTCHIHDGIPPMSLWGCVMRAYAQYNDNKTSRNGSRGAWWKLTEAMEQENLPLLDAHDALADVRMTLNLVRRMAGMDPLTFEDKDEIEDSPIGESAPEDATRVRLTLDNAQVGGWICYKGHPYRVLSVVEEWKTVNAIMSEEYRSRWTWRELSELGIHATVSIQPHQTVAYLGKCEECAQDDTKGDAQNSNQDDAQERSKTRLEAKNDADMTQHTANSVKTQGDDILTPPQPIQKPTLPATFPQPPASDRLHQLIQTMSESETEILLDLLQEHLDTLRTQRMRETVGRNPKPEVSKAIVQA